MIAYSRRPEHHQSKPRLSRASLQTIPLFESDATVISQREKERALFAAARAGELDELFSQRAKSTSIGNARKAA
jgi:hypothetical protein